MIVVFTNVFNIAMEGSSILEELTLIVEDSPGQRLGIDVVMPPYLPIPDLRCYR